MSAAADTLRLALDYAQRALNNVRNLQPYLGGVADMVAIHVEPRIPTAGITADGRLFVNPDWFLSLSGPEAIYVMSHELWHLVLQSHAAKEWPVAGRCRQSLGRGAGAVAEGWQRPFAWAPVSLG